MLYYLYVSNAGVPETGLVAGEDIVWESLYSGTEGTTKTGTSIVEIGGGWYYFDITFGSPPWDSITEDLVGVIDCDTDGDAGLANTDRYKSVLITKRGLALARIAHKGIQTKATGDVVIYGADDSTEEIKLDMSDVDGLITRDIISPTARDIS
jgi:hypothetical protein